MQEILQKAQDLWAELVKALQATTEQKKIYEDGIEANNKVSDTLKDWDDNLNAREGKIKSVENIVSLAKETNEKLEKLRSDQAEFDTQSKAFEDYQAQEKKTHSDLKVSLESSIKAADEKVEKYNSMLAELEEKKKNLVEEVTKEILSKK